MPKLPTLHGSKDVWDQELNDFLSVALNPNTGDLSGTELSALAAAAQLDGTEKFPAYQGAGVVGVLGRQVVSTEQDVRCGPGGSRFVAFEECEQAFTGVGDGGYAAVPRYGASILGTGAGQGGQQAAVEAFSGHAVFGVQQLVSGTSAPSRSVLCLVAATPAFASAARFGFLARLRIPTLSDGTNTFVVRAGFSKDQAAAAPTDGIYFEAQSGVANWRAINRGSSVSTDTDTTVAVDATKYTNLAIIYDGSTAHFYVSTVTANLVEIVTQSANLPAAASSMNPIIGIYKSAGATSRTVNVDVMAHNTPAPARGLTVRI